MVLQPEAETKDFWQGYHNVHHYISDIPTKHFKHHKQFLDTHQKICLKQMFCTSGDQLTECNSLKKVKKMLLFQISCTYFSFDFNNYSLVR